MEIKITKRTKLAEIRNDMCHNFYYLVYGKIINDEGTRMRRFRFVVWFDVFDILERVEGNIYTTDDIRATLDSMIDCYCQCIDSFDNCKDFYEICNESIRRYNNSLKC